MISMLTLFVPPTGPSLFHSIGYGERRIAVDAAPLVASGDLARGGAMRAPSSF